MSRHSNTDTNASTVGESRRLPLALERGLPALDGATLRAHVGLLLVVCLMALPLVIAALISFGTRATFTSVSELSLETAARNYHEVLFRYDMGQYMLNSLLMSVIVVVGKLAVSLLAALAIVYYRFPFKNAVFAVVLLTLMLPVPVRIVPLFQLAADLGWANSFAALTIPYLASATTVFLLRQHFLSIPVSLVESAKLDGVGPLRFLAFVLIPMSKGMIAGVSVIMFIYSWNQYLWPLLIVDDQSMQVAQVGIRLLQGVVESGDIAWPLLMAGSIVTLLPPLAVLIIFRKPLLETFGVE
ncbi:glycerol-3-phosphate ABC transporter permease [Halobiforma lacisalsi AJ5]|uniref:Glycerol-3-phosphate ABC transporter permease n=1 Tax=Natronobacterium lacisalsi AJ5 TaxID=358396 RepID=M0L6H7_NATLA|nr:carbohydrate ABC transporter permease [Halobiforma lacisalsi]APW97931.1 glycerol-3-phosphate ABC transporter permease [Halobiforma lacisalsi AJ5]EMA29202.1 sn-glycerol-3-phosphate transport system permease [Halobiforma lacisalsi AJ5]